MLSRLRCAIAAHLQRSHFAIEIRPLNAERLRRVADAPVVVIEYRLDVLALEARPRLAQRSRVGLRRVHADEPNVHEHVLDADTAPARQSVEHLPDPPPQTHGL